MSRTSAHLSRNMLFLSRVTYGVVALSSKAGGRTYLVLEVERAANPLSLTHYKRLASRLLTVTAGHLTEYLYPIMTGDVVPEM